MILNCLFDWAIIRILSIIIDINLILTGRVIFIKVDKLLFMLVCERIVVLILLFVSSMTLSLGTRRIALYLIMLLRLNYNWLLLLLQRIDNCWRSLLRCVLSLADTTFWTSRMIGFASVAGGTNIALVSPYSLTLITSETAPQMIRCTVCGSLIGTWAVYFLLDWWIAGSILTTSNLVLFFHDSSLGLIIKGREQILSMVRSQFLPYEEWFPTILPGLSICVNNALLDVSIYNMCITVKNSIVRI